jgi:protein-disulfide isomerase
MHDKLFANQKALTRPDLDKYATELQLDMAKFKADLDSGKFKEAVKKDQELGARFGARGTPTFFINGRALRGAQPIEGFKKTIDEEIAKADKLIAAGTPASGVYAEITKNGLAEAPKPPPPKAQPGAPDPKTVYKVDIGDAPVKGNKNAKVTVVIWSDYQCPFCTRAEATLKQVEKEYGDKVRFVFKDLPLPFHPNAKPAATVARVARESGKFWEMHDKLFANQKALARPDLEKYAAEMGLPEAKVKAALDSNKFEKQIDADVKQGAKLGANGTPAFFINGRFLSGAQPFEAFKAIIDEEAIKADALLKKGVKADKLYVELVKGGKTEVPAAAAGGGEEEDKKVYKVDAGPGPSKGPKDAPVSIVIFSDFECPFCGRVNPTIKQIEDSYKGKVRVTWRNYPLPFHQNAGPAAEAELAAHAQGKFWEMHDKLFANQKALSRPDLEKYATELGLDMGKFKADLDSGKFKDGIQKDIQYGNSISGPIGTPTMFVNGRKVSGAMPFESFKPLIDEALKKKRS